MGTYLVYHCLVDEHEQRRKGVGVPPLSKAEKAVVEAFQARLRAFLHGLISTHGVTHKELARRLGVSVPRAAKLLNEPTLSGVARVCAAIGVEPELRVRKSPAVGSLEL